MASTVASHTAAVIALLSKAKIKAMTCLVRLDSFFVIAVRNEAVCKLNIKLFQIKKHRLLLEIRNDAKLIMHMVTRHFDSDVYRRRNLLQ